MSFVDGVIRSGGEASGKFGNSGSKSARACFLGIALLCSAEVAVEPPRFVYEREKRMIERRGVGI